MSLLSRHDVYSYAANPQLDSSLEEEGESSFCVADNVQACAGYLSLELEALGFDSVVTEEGVDAVKMVNAMRGLLKLYRDTMSKIEDITSSLHRTQSDISLQWSAQTKLQSDLEGAESEIISLRERERQLRIKNKSLATKLRVECEEGKKLRLCMQSKTHQYCHDLKRKDREYERLKDRLGQLLMDKAQGKKLGMKLLNGLQQQSSTQRAKPLANGSSNQELYELMVANYEERMKELQLENTSLRETIAVMDKELVALLNMQKTRVNMEEEEQSEERAESCHAHHELFTSGYLQMPFSLVREGIEQSLTQRYQQLREYMQTLKCDKDLPQQEYDTEMDQLEQKLLDYRNIIDQQERMLQQQVASGNGDHGTPRLNESRLIQCLELVDLKEDSVKEQRRGLENAQRMLMEAAQQLDKEREEFEAVRSQFYKDRLFSTSVPATPNKTAHLDSFYSKLCSTPFSSSSYKNPYSIKSPSTSSTIRRSPIPSATHSKGGVDLNNSISLTSDDGDNMLNEIGHAQ